jgi:phage N-6-adenine-methyltransferase
VSANIGKRDPDKQGHRTPREFLDAVERRFGYISWDLAATDGHETGPEGARWTPNDDALVQHWDLPALGPVRWLNPPFANIRPWVAKLDAECRELPRWTLCLVPYSAGTKWWLDHVHEKCVVYSVGRMKFVGSTDPYPKDLALLAYGFGARGVVPLWDWKHDG